MTPPTTAARPRPLAYVGRRLATRTRVIASLPGHRYEDLPVRLDLHSHSPDGFEWGYGGSGPAQLALAILAHYLGDDARALHLYQRFKWDVVALLGGDGFRIEAAQLDAWLARQAVAGKGGAA